MNVKVTYLLKFDVGTMHVNIDIKVKAEQYIEICIGQANFARIAPKKVQYFQFPDIRPNGRISGSEQCFTLMALLGRWCKIYMSHFAYACKMRYPLNLVLESWEYLWFYWTFCIVILDYGLKLHNLLNHALVMLQKWLEIHLIIVWSSHCVLFSAIFATEKFQKKMSTLSLKLNYSSPRHQTAVFKVLISFKCS